MINFILKYPLLYRFYQKTVRSQYSEYDFFKFIFLNLKEKKLRVLDLCCGDSFILNYINQYIDDYYGIDFSDKYLNFSKKKWGKFKFKKLNLNNIDYLKEIKDFNPNFIFVNGALHHLDDLTVKNINKLSDIFSNSYFLSVDPVKSNNKIFNRLMIKFDRGKFIRNKDEYSNLMRSSKNTILDDFYKMSFKQILHYRNFELNDFYVKWKNSID
tara:strand:- start:7073 stop:7711 length:639 start_codon:yes stop_codon:yes gene_type:complete